MLSASQKKMSILLLLRGVERRVGTDIMNLVVEYMEPSTWWKLDTIHNKFKRSFEHITKCLRERHILFYERGSDYVYYKISPHFEYIVDYGKYRYRTNRIIDNQRILVIYTYFPKYHPNIPNSVEIVYIYLHILKKRLSYNCDINQLKRISHIEIVNSQLMVHMY